jgi:hypothetical protein
MNLPVSSPVLERPTEGIQANASLERLEGEVSRAGKRLTVFVAADDGETETWNGETIIKSEWLELPIVVEELGTMGGEESDRWEVLEVVQYANDRIIDVAIVHPTALLEPDRAKWLSTQGEKLCLYLDQDGEFITAGLRTEVSPRIGEPVTDFPIEIKSWQTYKPIGSASEHFKALYVCVCA